MQFSDDKIGLLLTYCGKCPELYNRVSNLLYKDFQIQSAEVSLLVTYICDQIMKNNEELSDAERYCGGY